MATTWVLVADGAEAHILEGPHLKGPLEPVQGFANAQGRVHARELVTDAPGRVHDRFGPGRHSMDAGQSVKDEMADRFARDVARYLAESRQAGRFDALALVAAPAMLGRLRGALDKPVADLVVAELDKDLVRAEPAEIAQRLWDR